VGYASRCVGCGGLHDSNLGRTIPRRGGSLENSGLVPGDFLDPVDLFPQLVDDGVTAVNLVPYQWNLDHNWHDSYGDPWIALVRVHQNRKCYIVSDVENTFDYGLVWDTL